MKYEGPAVLGQANPVPCEPPVTPEWLERLESSITFHKEKAASLCQLREHYLAQPEQIRKTIERNCYL